MAPRPAPFKPVKRVPKCWPPEVLYTPTPIPSARLLQLSQRNGHHHPILDHGRGSGRGSSGPCDDVAIKKITCDTHPAYGQYGLFASRKIPARTFVLVYAGVVHFSSSSSSTNANGEDESDPDSEYDLNLGNGLAIDATHAGNEARFINDYRGTPNAQRPNVCLFVLYTPPSLAFKKKKN
jgi:hypothetical protein